VISTQALRRTSTPLAAVPGGTREMVEVIGA
jgi:hypothetical protein